MGGTRVELRGRGFSSRTRVRLGAIDVPAADVLASDPFHVQVITPPGEVGEVDVQVTDEITGARSVLPSGFSYDAYYADPNIGATTGGTHVALIGRGTRWSDGTTVTIDGKPCTDLAVDDETHLRCIAPKGTPGTKSITVITPDSVVSTARDAYTYADTNDGYRGGLAGAKLPGELNVLALAYPEGDLVDSATVIV
ncbi:MAG: IPT/TIG domain-containing protein, partial [Polyangiales bacterium]